MPYKDQNDKQLYDKKYREINKATRYGKNECACGGCYTTNNNKSTHIKTKQHREHLGLPLIDKVPKLVPIKKYNSFY
jgi:hypothetical protein